MLNDEQFNELKTVLLAATNKRWLRTKDLPGYLNMADSTIRENLPDLPFHIVGGTKLYDPQEIDDFIRNK
ncbi:hypothetical protein C5L30_000272 [Companilactobacillus farciminis]|uniref:DNA-binding protein n=1 Tax=Companilactobacillus farciminis TaxID=1612 RepID=A0A4R5NIX1_9LACO|nr:hypothetical protein [Companilactobacillus farciminis]ATO46079.1 hypothetical protein LF20184_04620 [Companilactobacillus farciminis KCTC 3681 = DSM 20184]KRK62465.1 hypothetical protein FC68_GL001990 [Companilactobacillus farciminis KCTC 3681 = DSM 20184]TDG74556.1 hypothetical protein C5L30_000272 [Companilactobacillus farciminis]